MNDITTRISQYVADLRFEDIDEGTCEQIKLFIADYVAASLAGHRTNTAMNEAALQLMQADGGAEEATVWLSNQKLPAVNAAFMNALYAHGADMDDGNRKAAGHIASHVMSSVFALAESVGADWKTVFTAILAGYDVFNRVVGAAQPGIYNKGFHSTGIGGGLACAAACAKLLGADAERTYNALSLAAVQASGLLIIDESGQGCKPLNPANAARIGLFAARLAMLGVDPPRNPLESKKGWLNAFTDSIDEVTLFEELGQSYTINESYLKLYPSCRHTHCCIDAAIIIREQMQKDGKQLKDVESITIHTYTNAIRSTGGILYPKTAEEAKFSLTYCIATALDRGRFGLPELEVNIDPTICDIISKIQVIEDGAMEDKRQGIRGAAVIVTTKAGDVYKATVLIPKGEGKQRLSWEDIKCKLSACAVGILEDNEIVEKIEKIRYINLNSPYDPKTIFI